MSADVRPARVEDADSIGRVHVQTWQSCYRGQIPDEVLDSLSPSHRAEQWRRRLSTEPMHGAVYVAEVHGEVAGFASCSEATGDHAIEGAGELEAIYVLPRIWGTGTGRALLHAAEAWLRQAGFPDAMLWVLTANERARRFYEVAGWRCDGTEKMYERDGYEIPEVRYVRELRGAATAQPGEGSRG